MKTQISAEAWFSRVFITTLCSVAALLAPGPAGGAETIYVSNLAGKIEMYDVSTGAHLGVFASGLNLPTGLAFDRAGNLYVAISGDNIIEMFTTNGVGSVFSTGLSRPQGLALDSAGNLYVANYWDHDIVKFTPSGVGSVFATNVSPYGLAFDAAGNLYAADNTGAQIMKFTPEGTGSLLASGAFPRGLAYDNGGNLYAAFYGANRIIKFTPGGISSGFVTNGLRGPWWLAFDSAGCLYVSYDDGKGTIEKFAPNGTDLGAFASGTAGPGCIAVWPIPPSITVTSSPSTQTAEEGTAVDLRVQASGGMPLFYVWHYNGTNFLGCSTNCEFTLTNVQFSQSGAYVAVVSNALGTVTSSPAMLSVIPPVDRRPVPGVKVTGETASLLNVDYASSLRPAPSWAMLGSVSLTSTSQYYFDLALPFPPQRFYRAWQKETPDVIPSLDLHMVPAITLTGNIGGSVRLDYINQFGPIDAWVTLAAVTFTNTSQLYFDVSAFRQPTRLYRLVAVP